MLGRTAEDLFWLSRYVERAENTARLVEVAYRIGLMPRDGGGRFDEWRSALTSSGSERGYLERHGELDAGKVVDWMVFDGDNPSSVRACLDVARQNGRAQRTALTQDMWESLNTTWIELGGLDRARGRMEIGDLVAVLDWVKQRSALFRGSLTGTILRNDTWAFSQLGAFVERADNTARILDVKYYVLLPEAGMVGGGVDERQWGAILRSVSAHRSYQWVYRDAYRPWNVAELLILNRQMPRSLAFAYDRLVAALELLAELHGVRLPSGDAARATAEILRNRDVGEIFQAGLHEFLLDLRARNESLALQVAADCHFRGL
ncbi:MAG: alpha-E domain-containing protein [Alphaproteobacteria bacterium]